MDVVGYKSWRNPELGSWFMRDFVNVVGHNAHREHLADMLTQVCELFAQTFMEIVSTVTQCTLDMWTK